MKKQPNTKDELRETQTEMSNDVLIQKVEREICTTVATKHK